MDDDRLVLAEVKTLVGTIREDIHEMREEIRRSSQNSVTRLEWAQRNDTVDQRFGKQGQEISEVKQEMVTRTELKDVRAEVAEVKKEQQSKRLSVPVMFAIALPSLSLVWLVFGPLLTGETS